MLKLSDFLKQFLLEERLQRFEEVARERTRHLTIVLENVFHAHNASACLRTCDCFGIQDVHIVESRNRFETNEDIALGSSQWLTIHRYRPEPESEGEEIDPGKPSATSQCVTELKQRGYRVLATSPRQHSVPLQEIDVARPTALIFGAELSGVSDEAIELADQLIHIPMHGFTESFNISVSTALCLQYLTTEMRKLELDWRLSEDTITEIVNDWVRKSLGNKLPPLLRRFERDQSRETKN